MNRKLNQLESITYNNLKSVEIDIDGDEDLKNNKETKETNVIPNSFVSNNDEIYDSAFYNEFAQMIEVMKKGTITRSLLNNIGNFNASRNDKVITETYKEIPIVP